MVLGNILNLDAGNLSGLMDVELCVSISEIGNKIENEIYLNYGKFLFSSSRYAALECFININE